MKGVLAKVVQTCHPMRPLDAWDAYWFGAAADGCHQAPRALRVAVCLVTACWLLSFLPGISHWFSSDGLLSVGMATRLVEFEESLRWAHWSPLWLIEGTGWYQLYVLTGVAVALAAAFGWGGRWLLLALILLLIGWVHRIAWLQGSFAPLLIPFLAYLAVPPSRSSSNSLWLEHLSLRLFQTHWWMVFAMGLLSQLAQIDWWRGDAAWWLAAYGRSHVLTIDGFGGRAMWVNGLTHLLIAVQALALWWLLLPATRLLGLAAAWMALLGMAFLADQTLYSLLLGAGLLAFVPTAKAPPCPTAKH